MQIEGYDTPPPASKEATTESAMDMFDDAEAGKGDIEAPAPAPEPEETATPATHLEVEVTAAGPRTREPRKAIPRPRNGIAWGSHIAAAGVVALTTTCAVGVVYGAAKLLGVALAMLSALVSSGSFILLILIVAGVGYALSRA